MTPSSSPARPSPLGHVRAAVAGVSLGLALFALTHLFVVVVAAQNGPDTTPDPCDSQTSLGDGCPCGGGGGDMPT